MVGRTDREKESRCCGNAKPRIIWSGRDIAGKPYKNEGKVLCGKRGGIRQKTCLKALSEAYELLFDKCLVCGRLEAGLIWKRSVLF